LQGHIAWVAPTYGRGTSYFCCSELQMCKGGLLKVASSQPLPEAAQLLRFAQKCTRIVDYVDFCYLKDLLYSPVTAKSLGCAHMGAGRRIWERAVEQLYL